MAKESLIKMNKIPFDLEKYLQGEYDIVTRDGRSVEYVGCSTKNDVVFPIAIVISEERLISNHKVDGRFRNSYESSRDLFLVERQKPVDFTDLTRIKSYQDACNDQGKEILTIEDFKIFDEEERAYMYSVHRNTTIIRSLNRLPNGEYWKPDYNNSRENKYHIWYKWSSVGYSYYANYNAIDHSFVGSRLSFRTKEALLYFKDNFIKEANELLIS